MHCKSTNQLPRPALDPATCNRPVHIRVLRYLNMSNTQRNPKSQNRFRILVAFKTRNTIAIVCKDISGFELNDAESHQMLVIRPACGFGIEVHVSIVMRFSPSGFRMFTGNILPGPTISLRSTLQSRLESTMV